MATISAFVDLSRGAAIACDKSLAAETLLDFFYELGKVS
jgi:hypothetical protein